MKIKIINFDVEKRNDAYITVYFEKKKTDKENTKEVKHKEEKENMREVKH